MTHDIMTALSERLEVQLPPQILQLLRQEAVRCGVSLAELVREAIDFLLEEDQQAPLQAGEALFQIGAPVTDWEKMKQEIEEAYLGSRSK